MPEVRDALEAIEGTALLRWGRVCLDELAERREEINALNVFPIPDADTGTNLLATMRAAVASAQAVVEAAADDETVVGEVVFEPSEAAGPAESSSSSVPFESSRSFVAAWQRPTNSGTQSLGRRSEPSAVRGAVSTHAIAAAMARGATAGARGNSGIILSQVLRGIADAVHTGPLTARTLRVALARAAALVREGLSVPIEGTILTVLEAASTGAAGCRDATLADVALVAADSAAAALAATPTQLGVLRAAGVVDAGARGLVVLLDGLVAVSAGAAPARPDYSRDVTDAVLAERRAVESEAASAHYEVMYRLSRTDSSSVTRLRARLAELGDSVVVVDDGVGAWSAHVHCADAGAAVEAGLAAGTLAGIRIETIPSSAPAERPHGSHDTAASSGIDHLGQVHNLGPQGSSARSDEAGPVRAHAESHAVERKASGAVAPGAAQGVADDARRDHKRCARLAQVSANVVVAQSETANVVADPTAGSRGVEVGAAPAQPDAPDEPADRGVLAVVAGHGAAALFQDSGAVVLGAEEPVTAPALLDAIRAMPNREVLVLPNGALPAHELVAVGVAARDTHRDVLLLPSGSMVQGLAALAVHDRGRIAVDDTFAMSEAAATTRWGALRAANERALTMVGTCEAGDGLGLVGNDVVVIEREVFAAGVTLLDRMLAFGGELVTLLMGATAPPELSSGLAAHIGHGFPGVEVAVYSGGQPDDLVQIGVE
ncbi:DAK2 domain-containing protein [Nocardia callitridis]|uniref:DAK2 domain-containing protein n=1 Tax=Nocardia callitridis TaxID=648753 RepID=UPI0031F03B00